VKQEAQLSQRGRSMHHVAIGNVAKSLKVVRSYTVEYGRCKFLLVFRCNYVSIFYHLWLYIQRLIITCPWNNLGYNDIAEIFRFFRSMLPWIPSVDISLEPQLKTQVSLRRLCAHMLRSFKLQTFICYYPEQVKTRWCFGANTQWPNLIYIIMGSWWESTLLLGW